MYNIRQQNISEEISKLYNMLSTIYIENSPCINQNIFELKIEKAKSELINMKTIEDSTSYRYNHNYYYPQTDLPSIQSYMLPIQQNTLLLKFPIVQTYTSCSQQGFFPYTYAFAPMKNPMKLFPLITIDKINIRLINQDLNYPL
jgi:hypothetical protein